MYCIIKCIVQGKQARVKNADLRHPSCTVVIQKRKSASPVLNVLISPDQDTKDICDNRDLLSIEVSILILVLRFLISFFIKIICAGPIYYCHITCNHMRCSSQTLSSAYINNRLCASVFRRKKTHTIKPTFTSSPTACSYVSQISRPHILLMFLYRVHIHHSLSLSLYILLILSAGSVRFSADFHRPDVTKHLTEVVSLL